MSMLLMMRIGLSRRLLRALCLAIVAATAPASAAAQAQTLTPGDYTAEQARTIFADTGYQVSPMTTWDWVVPRVSVFRVEDGSRDRVLLVEVNSDEASAQIAGRRLPAGYTSSTWIYNLTLFEATRRDYQRLNDADLRFANGMQAGGADALLVASTPGAGVEQQYTDLIFGGAGV